MFCLIVFRRVWCFCVSRCVARLMRPGPRSDWPRPTKLVSNWYVCTRYGFHPGTPTQVKNHTCIQEINSLQNQNDGSSSDDKSSANRFLSKLRPINRLLLVSLIRSGKVNSSVSQVALRKARRCPYRGRSASSPYPYHSSRSPSASPTPSFVPPTGFSLWICFVAVRSSHLCRRSLWKKRRSVRVVGGQRVSLTFILPFFSFSVCFSYSHSFFSLFFHRWMQVSVCDVCWCSVCNVCGCRNVCGCCMLSVDAVCDVYGCCVDALCLWCL